MRVAIIKFLTSGSGLSFRAGKYFGEALLVGLFTGFVVVGFRFLIDFGGAMLIDSSWIRSYRYLLLVLPAVGALLGHLMIRRFSRLEHARGADSAIRAYHQNGGYITSVTIPVKSVASVLTVASGGSGGYEGPVTLIGAACVTVVLEVMTGIKVLAADGALMNTFRLAGESLIKWPGVLLGALLIVLTNFIRPVKNWHPIVFIAFSAVVGIVFRFAGV